MLGLERLETRRIHADLIMCYKIINQLVNTRFDQFLNQFNAAVHVVTH